MPRETVTTYTCDGPHSGGAVQTTDPKGWIIANDFGDGGFGVSRLEPEEAAEYRNNTRSYLCSLDCLAQFLALMLPPIQPTSDQPAPPKSDDDIPF